MPAGKVDRNVLASNYQEPGQTYDDKKTEGAFEVVAQQVDENWQEFTTHNHDNRYYTMQTMDQKLIHDHDGRYYTQAQLDAKFAQVQAGVIVDGTITSDKFAQEVRIKKTFKVVW